MTTNNTVQNFIVGEAVAVDVAAVEAELTSLWQSAAEPHDAEGAVMRACVLNLLVYVEDEESLATASGVIAEITRYHPCRAIVLTRHAFAEAHAITAWVSAHCRLPVAGSKQVCCEQITLAAGQLAFEELHSTVLPLLVSDLPVYLWWRGRADFSSHLLRSLLQNCDRVLVDSASFLQPERELAELARVVSGQQGYTAVVDLAWSRTLLWRGLTAQFFDSPDLRPALGMLRDVVIDYAADSKPNPIQALLICGWLLSRLRWQISKVQPEGAGIRAIECTRGDSAIRLRMQATTDPASGPAKGELLSISLTTLADPALCFSITRAHGTSSIVTHVSQGQSTLQHRVAHMAAPGDAQLLCGELEVVGRDRAFEDALLMAVSILQGES